MFVKFEKGLGYIFHSNSFSSNPIPSHASPTPSLSKSSCSGFDTSGQLSSSSQIPSESESIIQTPSQS